MDKFKLDDQEQEIEDSAQEYVPVDDAERERIERAIARSRKSKNINIRLIEADLDRIKTKADQEGLPHQNRAQNVHRPHVHIARFRTICRPRAVHMRKLTMHRGHFARVTMVLR